MAASSGNGGTKWSDVPPPFLTKTYVIVDDPTTNDIVSWSESGTTFVVWKPVEFARDLLPKHFKHNNFSSFVRQLNTYGFRKSDPDKWEFSNENFLRGSKDLLKDIHRRKSVKVTEKKQLEQLSNRNTLVEVGHFGSMDQGLDQLKRDREVLMMELIRIKQRQHMMEGQMMEMQSRMEKAETRQTMAEKNQAQMYQFIHKALKNPGLLHQMLQQQHFAIPAIESAEKVNSRKKPKQKRKSDSDPQLDLEPHAMGVQGVGGGGYNSFGDRMNPMPNAAPMQPSFMPPQAQGMDPYAGPMYSTGMANPEVSAPNDRLFSNMQDLHLKTEHGGSGLPLEDDEIPFLKQNVNPFQDGAYQDADPFLVN